LYVASVYTNDFQFWTKMFVNTLLLISFMLLVYKLENLRESLIKLRKKFFKR